ncbi:MAG: molybdenum ABC transporter ATP-binding protein [Planctomycetes bacterium]|nr:molybdenum ABC transporter ATP-binding protein [Planctomycetota bacterium]
MSGRWQVALRWRAGDFRLDVAFETDARVVALFGASGAGKSSVVEAVAGVLAAEGRVVVDGRELQGPGGSLPARRRRVGWMPQEGALLPHRTVEGNLAFAEAAAGADLAWRARALEVLGIGDLLDRYPAQLSGGERQRVALARALCARPRLLLLDEPLSGVDLPRRARVFRHLLEVRDGFELPMLYVSHDPAEVMAIAEHVVLLDQGRVVGQGAPRQLLGDAAALRFLDRLGFANVLRVEPVDPPAAGHAFQVRTPGGRLLVALPPPSSFAASGWLAVRAEDILLAAEPPHGLSARNLLPGVVAAIDDAGDHLLVRVDAGDEWVATLTRRAVRELDLAPGRPAWVVIKTHSMHWLAD